MKGTSASSARENLRKWLTVLRSGYESRKGRQVDAAGSGELLNPQSTSGPSYRQQKQRMLIASCEWKHEGEIKQ